MVGRRQIEEEHGRLVRRIERLQTKSERCTGELMQRAENAEARLLRDPIKALNLRYDEQNGLATDAIKLCSDLYNFTIGPLSSPVDSERQRFEPASHRSGRAVVTPLDLFDIYGLMVVAFRVENLDHDAPLRLSWLRKENAAYVLDEESGLYYSALSTSFAGDVQHGFPRTGLIAFEQVRQPTSSLQLHFSKSGKAAESFYFSLKTNEPVEKPTAIFVKKVREHLDDQLAQARKLKAPELPPVRPRASQAGCLVMLMLLVLTVVLLL